MPDKLDSDDLRNARGIGDVTAQKLKDAGVGTLTQLAVSRPEEIQSILGISLAKAKDACNSAKEQVLTSVVELKTAKEVQEHRKAIIKLISTGSSEFDRILGGGIPTSTITALAGQAATGKSQCVMSLAINCVTKLGRPVALLETEPNSVNPDRLAEIAEKRGVKIDFGKDIFIVTADSITDPFKQHLAYEVIEKKIQKGTDFGMIGIDSFVAKFRQHFLGREMLSGRGQEIARHINFLEYITAKYNIATVLTCQVGGIPDQGGQLNALMRFKIDKSIYGGEFFLHAVGILITLRQASSLEWVATTVDSPYLPVAKAAFKLSDKGIEDLPIGKT